MMTPRHKRIEMDSLRVGSYVRVSTDDQDLALQEAKLAAVKGLHPNWNVYLFVDRGLSGMNGEEGRPGFKDLMTACRAGEIDGVWVYSLSRLSRRTATLLAVADELRDLNIRLMSFTESLDTSTPSGKFTFTILAALAQMERDMTSQRTTDALRAKRIRGEKFGRGFGLSIAQEEEIRKILDADETLSTRQVAEKISGTSHSSVARFMRKIRAGR